MRSAERILSLLGAETTAHGAKLQVDRAHVDVAFLSGRSQRVWVAEEENHLVLESVAVRQADEVLGRSRLDELILRMNYETDTVGLRRQNGALTTFVKVLKRTLDHEEAIQAIVAVAREADRLEQLTTGRDDE